MVKVGSRVRRWYGSLHPANHDTGTVIAIDGSYVRVAWDKAPVVMRHRESDIVLADEEQK